MAADSDSEYEADNYVTESYKPSFIEMIKSTSEMYGVTGLSDECFDELYEQCSFIVKLVIQQSIKFADKNNHQRMTIEDVRLGVKSKNIDPVYGYSATEPIVYKHARGGGKEFFFIDEREINFNDVANAALPKVPLECTLRPYWIAINGIPPAAKEKSSTNVDREQSAFSSSSQLPTPTESDALRMKRKFSDKVMVKEVTVHELSLEQQHYYIEITEACIGNNEERRNEALESLKVDTGLAPMLPRFCNFIFGGVKINVVQNTMAVLIYLMRMCKALVDNSNLQLQPYLHEIVPSVLTCIVCRQLCLKPDVDNHWALREFAGRLLCQICRSFNAKVNRLQARVTGYLSATLRDESTPPATQYGAIFCLGELGFEAATNFILPHVGQISCKLSPILDNSIGMPVAPNVDKVAAERIKAVVLKILPTVIKRMRQPPYNLEDFQVDYGTFLGPLLHEAVMKIHMHQTMTTSQSFAGQLSTPLVAGRTTLLSVGLPLSQPGGQSQVIRVAPTSLGIPVPPSTPARQNVVFISPQQRLPPISTNNVQSNSVPAAPHFVRLIPTGSASVANQPPFSFNEQ